MTVDFLLRLPILGLLILVFVTQGLAQDGVKAQPLSRKMQRESPREAVATESGPAVEVERQGPTSGSKSKGTLATGPLSARRKLQYGLRQAFFTPAAYVGPAFGAYLTERIEVKAPGKTADDKFADGLSRFAISFATNSTAQALGLGVFPIIFKQDPRYKSSGRHGLMTRALYAAGRTLVRQGDNGQTQVNYSGLAGNLTSAALANIYERDRVSARDARGRVLSFNRHVGVGPTFISFGVSEALEATSHIAFDEFDILGRLRKLFGKH